MASYTSEKIGKLKDGLKINPEAIQAAYERLEKVLDAELEIIKAQGSNVIPETTLSDILDNKGQIPADVQDVVRKRGVLIVRNTLSKHEAASYLQEISSYMTNNGENPNQMGSTLYEIYWSKPQVAARQHPNLIAVQKAVLQMWNTNPFWDSSTNLEQPLSYIDRLRYRKPGDETFTLKPHLDSGSIARWSDPVYKNCYDSIFKGNWEHHDPFCVNGRGLVLMDEHCSFFRAFQGWTSLVESGPGDGTLRVLPLLKEAIAYIMMRPLLKDVDRNELPSYHPGKLLYLDYEKHSKLIDAMVSVPKVNPGDTVWWHADILHSVEQEHNGKETNVVLYIPAGPDCPVNRLYVDRMKRLFIKGLGPPDFQKRPENEKEFVDRATFEDLNDDGKVMMGFEFIHDI